eukprot:Gb_17141 [translate_table: standard]
MPFKGHDKCDEVDRELIVRRGLHSMQTFADKLTGMSWAHETRTGMQRAMGAGSLEDHGSLVAAVKQVNIVISCVGVQISDQLRIIDAIKQVGTIKRFLPSKFGNDVYRVQAVEPAKGLFGYFLANLVQPGLTAPPRDKVVIYGDGNAKAVMMEEEDIATYTIKAADDPRTLNKTLYLRPSANTKSHNELVALWEHKIGKALEKVILPEEQLLQQIQDTPFPNNIVLSIVHDIFSRGD